MTGAVARVDSGQGAGTAGGDRRRNRLQRNPGGGEQTVECPEVSRASTFCGILVPMPVLADLPVEVLEDLHAAAAASRDVHLDICGMYNTESLDEPGCTCGMPRLLRSLAEYLPLPAGASQPYRPAWTPARAA